MRLGLEAEITQVLSLDMMLPAPGQGALGIECRSNDAELLEMLQTLHDRKTDAEVSAERSFLHALGAGCNTPVAARAVATSDGLLSFHGRCLSGDGSQSIEVHGECQVEEAVVLGQRMADSAISRGFSKLTPSIV